VTATATEPRTRRFEARLDPESDDRIARAAALCGQSRSAFIVQAAREAADRQLARADVTLMPAAQFEAMMETLDEVEPLPELAALLARPRAYHRA